MTKNPFINAGAAAVYIGAVVLFINFIAEPNEPDTLFIPMAMLSLLVLSVLVMSYLFFAQPLQLYFDEKKKEALSLFVQTVACFALITVLCIAAMLFLPN